MTTMSERLFARPLRDIVVILQDETPEMAGEGVFMPDTARDAVHHKPKTGTVVACGPGKLLDDGTRVPVDLAIGDKVAFSAYSGAEITNNDIHYLVMTENDILVVFGEA